MRENGRVLTVYFAGDLFDAKDLVGNLLLAQAVEKYSGGRYKINLPQDRECQVTQRSAQSIRDEDFRLLLASDIIVANFDGTDLDSGTVVEFCFAKMTDMPAVLLRTDFRSGGDASLPDNVPWNLMASHFPRTEVLHVNSMKLYHEFKTVGDVSEKLEKYYRKIAVAVIEKLDSVTRERSWLTPDKLSDALYMAVKSIGGDAGNIFNDEELRFLATHKLTSGLYQA